jgi:hypothetical protein
MYASSESPVVERQLLGRRVVEILEDDDVEAFDELVSSRAIPLNNLILAVATTPVPNITKKLAAVGTACTLRAAITAANNGNALFLKSIIPGCSIHIREAVLFVLLLAGDPERTREFVESVPPPYCSDVRGVRRFIGADSEDTYASDFEDVWAWPVSANYTSGYVNHIAASVAMREIDSW